MLFIDDNYNAPLIIIEKRNYMRLFCFTTQSEIKHLKFYFQKESLHTNLLA